MRESRLFNLVSLGCPKNRVDTERILAEMTATGFRYTDDPSDAGIIIINTCAFIEAAVEESIAAILNCRRENADAFLVVAGCLPLRYREQLQEPLPEVNLFLTPDRIHDLPRLLIQAAGRGEGKRTTLDRGGRSEGAEAVHRNPRVLTTSGYAYLRIAEGCSRTCRYCTIPSIRGPLESFDLIDLEREAQFLVSQGARELVLVAQDLTGYGVDRHEKRALITLLQRISAIDGLRWLRLMYLHPDGVKSELAELVRDSETILPYLDIPFQHVSEVVLKAMGRSWKGDRIRKLVDRLRREIPGLVLRTTLMVGYPAEGEKEFQELRDFVAAYEIEHVGVFAYSPEEGTRAAALGDPIPRPVKEARAEEIGRIHAAFAARRNRGRIRCVEDALIEGVSTETELLLQGRTWDQAPDVDGILYITSGNAVPGEIRSVRITAAHGHDLFGEIVQPTS